MDLGLGELITIVAVAILLVPAAAGAVLVILIVSNRADPDPTGRRPTAVYSYGAAFLTLFVSLFASFVIVAELTSMIGSHHTGSTSFSGFGSSTDGGFSSGAPDLFGASQGPKHAFGDGVARGVVIGGLLLLVAHGVYRRHIRSGNESTAGLAYGDPAGRVRSSYLAAVSFICMVIAVIATVVATYQIFRLIGPGVFNAGGHGNRVDAVRTGLPFAYLAIVARSLRRRHASALPPTTG
jgi:hypothetical protein